MYTGSLRNGEVWAAFLGLRNLRDGKAESIMAAYKQAMVRARLPAEKWVPRMLWYCADGAEVMQSTMCKMKPKNEEKKQEKQKKRFSLMCPSTHQHPC